MIHEVLEARALKDPAREGVCLKTPSLLSKVQQSFPMLEKTVLEDTYQG